MVKGKWWDKSTERGSVLGMLNEYRLTDYPYSNRSSNLKIKKRDSKFSMSRMHHWHMLFNVYVFAITITYVEWMIKQLKPRCFFVSFAYCIEIKVPPRFESMIIPGTMYGLGLHSERCQAEMATVKLATPKRQQSITGHQYLMSLKWRKSRQTNNNTKNNLPFWPHSKWPCTRCTAVVVSQCPVVSGHCQGVPVCVGHISPVWAAVFSSRSFDQQAAIMARPRPRGHCHLSVWKPVGLSSNVRSDRTFLLRYFWPSCFLLCEQNR